MKTRKLFVSMTLFILLGSLSVLSTGCWAIPEDRSTGDFVKEDRSVCFHNPV